LLIDGSPTNFALHNISEGGVMGDNLLHLLPGAKVQVRFETGMIVPAVVKWAENGLVGLAFSNPLVVESSPQPAPSASAH
jgi:hypothetical protein